MATKTYRLLSGKHCRFEGKGRPQNPQTYRAGDPIDLTEEEAAGPSLAGRIEPISEAPKAKAPRTEAAAPAEPKPETEVATETTEDTAPEYGLADLPWSEAADVISWLDTVEEVEAARAEEVAGKDRKGVTKAADERLAELGD